MLTSSMRRAEAGRVCLALALGLVVGLTFVAGRAQAASWLECNGKPVRPKPNAIDFRMNSCSLSSYDTPTGRSVVNAVSELKRYTRVRSAWLGSGDACVMDHDNDDWDVGVTSAAAIDGNLGLTVQRYSSCFWSWDESVIEVADVMVQSVLDFNEPDESFVGTTSSARGMGRGVMLHEMGHAVGLEHSTAFAMMRDGMARRIPWTGSIYENASKVALAPDDVLGLRNLNGIPQDYPNMFVSAQFRDTRNGTDVIRDAGVNPATGNALSSVEERCPGEQLSFYVTVGNHSQFSKQVDFRVYSDVLLPSGKPDACTPLDGVGTELYRGWVRPNGYSTYSFALNVTVPASAPRGVRMAVYAALDPSNTLYPNEKKGYDNCARYGFQLRVKSVVTCGR